MSPCCELNFRYRACFEQGIPWHSGHYIVWIHSEKRIWHDKNISTVKIICFWNFIEITLRHGCFPVICCMFSQHLFIRPFMEGCFWMKWRGIKELELLKHFSLKVQEATSKNDAIIEKKENTSFLRLQKILLLMIANKW